MAYDARSRITFESIDDRYTSLLETAAENCSIVLTGTKKDLVTDSNREITAEAGIVKAKELSDRWNSKEHPSGRTPFFETSSLTGENVQQLFEYIFETLTHTVDRKECDSKETVDISKDKMNSNSTSKSKCGC